MPVPGCTGHFLWAVLVSLTSVLLTDALVYARDFKGQGHCSRALFSPKSS